MTDEIINNNPVIDIINEMVEKKTFSLDALSQVQKLKELAEKQAKDLLYRDSSIRSLKNEMERWHVQSNKFEADLKVWTLREKALIERETKCHEVEKNAAVSKAVADTFDKINERMFANRTFRERLTESIHGTEPHASYGTMTTSRNSTKERTTEEK